MLSLNKARRSRELSGIAKGREKTRCAQAGLCKAEGSGFASTADSSGSIERALREDAIGVEAASPDGSPARLERLAVLRTAIAEGRYRVSAAELAQKLMDHMLALQPEKIGSGQVGPAKIRPGKKQPVQDRSVQDRSAQDQKAQEQPAQDFPAKKRPAKN
jgi:anti-sigma28 factor (negative regulator of flagellin synthesis)